MSEHHTGGAAADAVVHLRGVRKVYGDTTALDGIDLDVGRGTIIGLIGPSGCGKTTLVRTVIGLTTPTEGEVSVFGADPTRFSTDDRRRFGYMPQIPVLFPNLSAWRNLTFVASVYGLPVRRRRAHLLRLLELVDLAEHRHKRLADLSGGMQRRLTLAATLVHQPELVILDEPTAGVDPILRERFWSHFRALRDQGRTLIVPTQYVGEAVSCDRVAVMSEGRLLTVASPDDLVTLAYGGDPVLVHLGGGWLSGEDVARLTRLPFVRSVRRADDGLVFGVEDEHRDAPRLAQELAGTMALTVGPYEPSYDEIFVEIVEADRARHARTVAAGVA